VLRIITRRYIPNNEKLDHDDEQTTNGIVGFVFTRFAINFLILFIPFMMYNFFYHPEFSTKLLMVLGVVLLSSIVTVIMVIRLRRRIPQADKDIEVLIVKTGRILQKPNDNSTHFGYFIDVHLNGKKHVLYLNNKIIDEKVAEGLFPNTSFEILRTRDTAVIFDIIVKGEYLEPEIIEPWNEANYLNDEVPADGEILECSIEEIR